MKSLDGVVEHVGREGDEMTPEECARLSACWDCGWMTPSTVFGDLQETVTRTVFLCPDCQRPTCWRCATTRHQLDGFEGASPSCQLPDGMLRHVEPKDIVVSVQVDELYGFASSPEFVRTFPPEEHGGEG